MITKKTIVLLGGGTGGHIFPLISLYKGLTKNTLHPKLMEITEGFRDFQFVFMGERGDTMEHQVAIKEGLPFVGIYSGKLRRYFSWKTLLVPFLLKLGGIQSFWYFLWNRPFFVFSKGGYVSLPAAIAAWMLRIPVYLHESDAVPGLANRLVGRFSKKVFLGFSDAAKYFSVGKTEVIGQILNSEILALGNPAVTRIFPEGNKPKLLIVCGSLGSARVFDAVLSCPQETLDRYSIAVTLGTLNNSFRSRFEAVGVKVYDFLNQSDMMQAYAEADIAITRAGATTLGELEAFEVKMIIVPLEGAANDHQNANAKAYEKKGATIVKEDQIDQLSVEL